MEVEEWDVEIAPEIAEWLGHSRSNLIAEITYIADRRGLDVEIRPAAGHSESKDVAMILFASAAVIKALNPLILAAIKVRFPDATTSETKNKNNKKKLKVATG